MQKAQKIAQYKMLVTITLKTNTVFDQFLTVNSSDENSQYLKTGPSLTVIAIIITTIELKQP